MHEKLTVICLISDETIKACQALTRRAPHLIWPSGIERPRFEISFSNDESTGKGLIEIDLFNNVSRWDAETKGKVFFTNKGPVFQPGILTADLSKEKKHIIFQNPPLKILISSMKPLCGRYKKRGMVNGELTTLPDHFQWEWCRSIINKITASPKISFLNPLVASLFALSLRQDLDIFYLSKANFSQLTEDYYIDKSNCYQTTGGWLNQNNNRQKLIIATEALNKDQERELLIILKGQSYPK